MPTRNTPFLDEKPGPREVPETGVEPVLPCGNRILNRTEEIGPSPVGDSVVVDKPPKSTGDIGTQQTPSGDIDSDEFCYPDATGGRPASPGQVRALAFIKGYIARWGFAPTYREIAEGVDISIGGAQYAVAGLVTRGVIRRIHGAARAISLVEGAEL